MGGGQESSEGARKLQVILKAAGLKLKPSLAPAHIESLLHVTLSLCYQQKVGIERLTWLGSTQQTSCWYRVEYGQLAQRPGETDPEHERRLQHEGFRAPRRLFTAKGAAPGELTALAGYAAAPLASEHRTATSGPDETPRVKALSSVACLCPAKAQDTATLITSWELMWVLLMQKPTRLSQGPLIRTLQAPRMRQLGLGRTGMMSKQGRLSRRCRLSRLGIPLPRRRAKM